MIESVTKLDALISVRQRWFNREFSSNYVKYSYFFETSFEKKHPTVAHQNRVFSTSMYRLTHKHYCVRICQVATYLISIPSRNRVLLKFSSKHRTFFKVFFVSYASFFPTTPQIVSFRSDKQIHRIMVHVDIPLTERTRRRICMPTLAQALNWSHKSINSMNTFAENGFIGVC